MTTYGMRITLLSEALPGRGEGVAGLVDSEIENDAVTGLPLIKGKTLKGLLVETCADILFALKLQSNSRVSVLESAADFLFGHAQGLAPGKLFVGTARLPSLLEDAVQAALDNGDFTREEIIGSLTDIRRQTAIDTTTGSPKKNSLRSIRVLLRDLTLRADLVFSTEPEALHLGLLSACIMGTRRLGTSRNRGLGRIQADLLDSEGNPVTGTYLDSFIKFIDSKDGGK